MIKRYSDHAANERTFLAWVRTAIAVMAFGFVIERFDLFLQVAAPQIGAEASRAARPEVRQHGRTCLHRHRRAMIVVAGFRFVKTAKDIETDDDVPSPGERFDLALAVLIGAVGRRAVSLSVARGAAGDLTPFARTERLNVSRRVAWSRRRTALTEHLFAGRLIFYSWLSPSF